MKRTLGALLFLALAGGFVLPASGPVFADSTYEEWKKADPDAAKDWLDKMKDEFPDKSEDDLIKEYDKQNAPEPPPADNPNTAD